MTLKSFDFGFTAGISCIRIGYFNDSESPSFVCASQNGEVKIISFDETLQDYELNGQFDLSENGAIWSLECVDVNSDGKDELIIGGMQGAVVCITSKGDELWVHKCDSAISGLYIWHNHGLGFETPAIVIYSLDRTIRVLNGDGKMIWAQMFASGVACVISGDINNDGQEEIVAGGNDGTIRVFEGKTGKIIWFLDLKANVRSIAIINNIIITGGDNKKVDIIDGVTHQILHSKEFPTYVWKILSVPGNEAKNNVLISTFSFRYLDMDDAGGEPSIGLYKLPELSPIWESEKVNAQDLCLVKSEKLTHHPLFLSIGETSGMVSLIKLLDGGPVDHTSFHQLPSVVNAVSALIIRKNQDLQGLFLLSGCDDSKLYALLVDIDNKEEKSL
jgi:WD40 repeat protein